MAVTAEQVVIGAGTTCLLGVLAELFAGSPVRIGGPGILHDIPHAPEQGDTF